MSLAKKTRLVGWLLAAVTLWPLVHFGLARTVGISPWKLFGWAMYTTPRPRVLAYVLEGGTERQLPFDTLSPARQRELLAAYDAFSKLRIELGSWVEPDEFGQLALRAYPNVASIDIAVERWVLGRTSARIEKAGPRALYRYSR